MSQDKYYKEQRKKLRDLAQAHTAGVQNLLEHLQEQYPNKVPLKRLDDYGLAVLQGRQQVINYIETLMEQANPEED